ncbi:unnamed protein product [Closterium sp. Yama58-4]|nr:unnamed protein product [Closterium sp. Yama58-4]
MARNLIFVLVALLATTTLCHGARPFLTALLTSDPYAALAVVEAGNDRPKNQIAEADVVAADSDNTASVAGATEIVSTAADNDNVASAIHGTMTADVDSDSVGFLTASVSLPGSDNVIAALNVPRRKGSLVSVIDDPTDDTASVGASTSAAVIDADLSDNTASAATTVKFDDPTDNTASVGASAASAAVIVDDLGDNTASAVATTATVDDPTDNTASVATSAATVIDDPTDNTASVASAATVVDDPTDNTASAREGATTTAYVSLPGSDNEIYAYRVPARREGMLVVVNGEGSS